MNQQPIDLDKFLQGDPQTLEMLYSNCFDGVKKYVLSNGGSKMDADDLFQNGLVQLFMKAKNETLEVQSFESYLFVVCRNLWRKQITQQRVTKLQDQTLKDETLTESTFYEEQAQWELYIEKFGALSEKCRELLTLVFSKTSYEDIVKKYSYSSQTVARQRVFKCKARLVKLIKQDNRYTRLVRRR